MHIDFLRSRGQLTAGSAAACAILILLHCQGCIAEGQCGIEPSLSLDRQVMSLSSDGDILFLSKYAAEAGRHIIDITKGLSAETLHWDSEHGLGSFRERYTRIEDGDLANQSQLKDFPVHVATHVDAASHFSQEHFETGEGVEGLDLHKLNGAVLVIEVPHDKNITAETLSALHIPPGTQRILFKTLNTERGLMHKTPFIRDYTAMTQDGAQWVVDNGHIEMVGIDYTSIAIYEDLTGPHMTLLPNDVVVLEGVVLDDVAPGLYDIHCLPMKLTGSDGAPARCILVP